MAEASEQTLSLTAANQAWDVLAERVEAFLADWEQAVTPPDLAQRLPAEPPALRRMVLVELIKVDLEHRWHSQMAPRLVEDYLSDFPELADGEGVSCDLLYEEFHVRQQSGEEVDRREYFERFPQMAPQLERLLGANPSTASTCVFQRTTSVMPEVGQRVDDFTLLAQLGKGAFATVFLARQESMQRLVALKVSAEKGTEHQTLAQMDHPHIVRVYDQRVKKEPDEEVGLRLLYMQYVPGGTLEGIVDELRGMPHEQMNGDKLLWALDEALDSRGESPPVGTPTRKALSEGGWAEVVCRVGAQLASALEYAHARGVLHRDLKPANILMAADGTPKLADFNISFCSKVDGATPAAYFGGSLAYMSPEQLEACNPMHDREPEELDGRSDIYSLGVVLWELFDRQRPFADEQVAGGWVGTLQAMVERRQTVPEPPERCPPGLRAVLKKCLAPQKEDRYACGAELSRALLLCLHPEAERLIETRGRPWKRLAQRLYIPMLLLFAVAPNAAAAWFNHAYNHDFIERNLQDAMPTFQMLVLAINGVSFPMGMGIIVWLAWPVARALRARSTIPAEQWPFIRHRALRMGHYVGMIGVALWAIAGCLYPVGLGLAGAPVGAFGSGRFIISLLFCGLIAAAYPFFLITGATLRAIYPVLLQTSTDDRTETNSLSWLDREMWIYLGLAAGVPMLSVVAMAAEVSNAMADSVRFLAMLALGSLVGFCLVFALILFMRRDTNSLRFVLDPTGE